MYSRRAALVTSSSLRRGIKVCRRNAADFRHFAEISNFVRNFGTATKTVEVYTEFDDYLDYVYSNRNDLFDSIDKNQKPSRGYGKIGTGRLNFSNTFGSDSRQNQSGYNSVRFDSRVHAQNIVRGEVNRIPNRLQDQKFDDPLSDYVYGDYGRNLGGIDQNQNPSRGYGEIGTGTLNSSNTFGSDSRQNQLGYNSARLDCRVHVRNIVLGEVNQIPNRLHGQNFGGQLGSGTFQQNVSSNGYGNGGILDMTPQNRGGVYPENLRGGSYGGKEDIPVKNVDSAGVRTATANVYPEFDDYLSDYVYSNRTDLFDQNQNPSRGYGKIGAGMLNLSNTFGSDSRQNQSGYNSARFDSRVHARNIVRGEVNRIPNRLHGQNFGGQLGSGIFQPNVSSNGYGNGGVLDTTPQNRGGVYPENSRGGSYGGKEDIPVKNVDSAGVRTATANVYTEFDDYLSDYVYSNRTDLFDQNQNPSRGYGKIGAGMLNLSNTFGSDSPQNQSGYNSARFDSRVYARNIVCGEVNRIPNRLHGQNFGGQLGSGTFQQNVSSNGYGNGEILDTTPQNLGVVYPENSRGGSYGGKEDIPVKNVDSAEVHPQNVAGSYYSNAGDYPRSLSESQSGVGTYSPVMADVALNAGSVKVAQESQSARTLDDLDQFTREGKLKEAVELLGLLEEESVRVELLRYMALVKACGENEALAEAKSVHEHLVKSRGHLEVGTHNQILEMYSKCGSMKDAFAVFDQMPERNLTSWDIMVSWLAKNGHGEESLELFSEFKQSGLRPDGQMFHGVFSACGVVSDIIEGMLQFESMMNDYGIVPAMEHYVSIVDMLGNAGCLDEALEFIQKMPVEPSVEIWETLMKFCRIHGSTVLGDQCAELVQLLDPSRLHEQSREGLIPLHASDLEKEKEKKKLSGQGPLDVRHKVHEYRAGDRSHPDNDRLYGLLRGLKEQMKEAGYVPEVKCVLHDVDQETKEEALMAHSERLAAAHGFLTSPARASVRIIKNLRICSDCHNVFKIIAKIVGREIVARDSKRFHHFRDGSCSCNDFW